MRNTEQTLTAIAVDIHGEIMDAISSAESAADAGVVLASLHLLTSAAIDRGATPEALQAAISIVVDRYVN